MDVYNNENLNGNLRDIIKQKINIQVAIFVRFTKQKSNTEFTSNTLLIVYIRRSVIY